MGFYQMVTVRGGDCLWTIAQRYLGDGDLYPEIVKLNLGHEMGDGQTFTDPSVIWPGWVLQVPASPGPAPSSTAPPAPAGHGASLHAGHDSSHPRFRHPHPAASVGQPAADPAGAPAGTPATGARAPAPAQPTARAAASAQPVADQLTQIPPFAVFGAGVLVGGASVALARMRRRQRQARRSGRRIPLPASAPVIAAEQRLRAAAQAPAEEPGPGPRSYARAAPDSGPALYDGAGPELYDGTGPGAVRRGRLAPYDEAGRRCTAPRIPSWRCTARRIPSWRCTRRRSRWCSPTCRPSPARCRRRRRCGPRSASSAPAWSRRGSRSRASPASGSTGPAWNCCSTARPASRPRTVRRAGRTAGHGLAAGAAAARAAAPFPPGQAGDLLPGLLTAGVAADGGYVLIDLEYLRVTTVDGPADLADLVLATAAAELTTSQLAGWYDLILAGFPELDPVDGRATSCASLAEALDLLAAKAVALRRRLGDADRADVRRRRLADPGDEDWALTLLVSRTAPTADQMAMLLDLASDPGGIAALVVGGTDAPEGHPAPASFRLSADPARPGGIVGHVSPAAPGRLAAAAGQDDYQALASLFATAADLQDVAADAPPYDGSSWPPAPGLVGLEEPPDPDPRPRSASTSPRAVRAGPRRSLAPGEDSARGARPATADEAAGPACGSASWGRSRSTGPRPRCSPRRASSSWLSP